MQPTITPAILVSTFEEFERQVKKFETLFPYAQVDVMDGKFVTTKSFSDIERVGEVATPLKYELHLMVEHPLEYFKRWAGVKNVFRVLFHVEAKDNPTECLAAARARGWEVGMVLNPDTPLSAVEPYFNEIDVVLFMTVHPGRQGAPFVPEVLKKIREFVRLRDATSETSPYPPLVGRGGGDVATPLSNKEGAQGEISTVPLCAADGAVNPTTIEQLRDAGVEIFNVGSYLTKAEDIKIARKELKQALAR